MFGHRGDKPLLKKVLFLIATTFIFSTHWRYGRAENACDGTLVARTDLKSVSLNQNINLTRVKGCVTFPTDPSDLLCARDPPCTTRWPTCEVHVVHVDPLTFTTNWDDPVCFYLMLTLSTLLMLLKRTLIFWAPMCGEWVTTAYDVYKEDRRVLRASGVSLASLSFSFAHAHALTSLHHSPLMSHRCFSTLPASLSWSIWSLLTPLEVCQTQRVCRQWYLAGTCPRLWYHLLGRDFVILSSHDPGITPDGITST